MLIQLFYTHFTEDFSENIFQHLLSKYSFWSAQVLSFRQVADQKRFLLAKALLQKAFPDKSPSQLRTLSNNRPYFPDFEGDFNISHSENVVVLAFSDTPYLGIDIERVKTIEIRDFEDFFTKEEWHNIVQSSSPIYTFYHYWTRKEAFYKSLGVGFLDEWKHIHIHPNKIEFKSYTRFLSPVSLFPDYTLHIATSQPIDSIRLFYWNLEDL